MLNSLIQQIKLVKDFRKKCGKRHQLWVVLTIILLAMLVGNVTYKAIDEFKNNEAHKLIQVLKIPSKKLPSYSTIRRVMLGVNLLDIQSMFQGMIDKYYGEKEELDWIAIDGKGLKNTLKNYENEQQNMLTMVSWFSQETKLVIKAESFESKKESENRKVRSMIETGGLFNKVLTLDALHCSKKTTKAIIESQNDYLITVKRNQIKLFNRLKYLAKSETPLTVYQSKDNSHGRYVTRKVSVFDGQKVQHKNYPHIRSFIEIKRRGFRGNKEYNQTLYYISSQKLDAQIFARKIQEHWLIEHQVHWVKDVIFNEDKSRIKGIEVAEKFSLFVTIVLNIYRSLGFISIKEGQSWLGRNWSKILAIA
jgi:predicted transposase YbfD/YdcC